MKPIATQPQSVSSPRSQRTLQRGFTVALLAAALAACQATGPMNDSNDEAGGSSGARSQVRSPASERVIGGIAEMVLTDRAWPSFEEARANQIEAVADGSPLFAYIRATRPLGEIAHPANPGGSYSFSDFAHLQIQIGDVESLRIATTCYVTMTPEEARSRELVVPLAPLTFRPGQVPADCWLEAVSGSRSGPRTYEVRLAGFPGKFESWLPVPDLMAVAPVDTRFENGAGEYATMLRATPLRSATVVASAGNVPVAGSALIPLDGSRTGSGAGSAANPGSSLVPVGAAAAPAAPAASSTLVPAEPASNPTAIVVPSRPETARGATTIISAPITTVNTDAAPVMAALSPAALAAAAAAPVRSTTLVPAGTPLPGSRQEIGSSRMELQLRTLSVAALGRQPSDSYFTERAWTGQSDNRGRVQVQQVNAAAVFRGETCSWQPLVVTRRPGALTLTDVSVAGDPIVVSCAELP